MITHALTIKEFRKLSLLLANTQSTRLTLEIFEAFICNKFKGTYTLSEDNVAAGYLHGVITFNLKKDYNWFLLHV